LEFYVKRGHFSYRYQCILSALMFSSAGSNTKCLVKFETGQFWQGWVQPYCLHQSIISLLHFFRSYFSVIGIVGYRVNFWVKTNIV